MSYRSLRQSSANGFELPDDNLSSAECLDSSQNMGGFMGGFMGATTDLLTGVGTNPFANVSALFGVNSALGLNPSGTLL